MTSRVLCRLLAAGVGFLACWVGPVAADPLTLTVHADRPGVKVSPRLFGIFFEDVNHAGDGGIYAEMVRNRSFDGPNPAESWSLVAEGGGQGTMAIDTDRPLNAATPRSLKLVVTEAGSGRVGVANNGYWGMSVRKGARYDLSFFARADAAFHGPLAVSLESAAGVVYGRASVDVAGDAWKRYRVSLASSARAPAARLVLAVSARGTIWLDCVSLFPRDTFKGRPNGLRVDLGSMMADLKPAFMRFPGGCVVEGDQLVNAFRWKTTLGDISERPGHWDLWGYHSTDGLGYHEYLQMCEDFGAEPLFVINCGMAHGGNVPLDQLDPWVQDALDAIEYANGPTTSKWGALRAKAGHPAPFNLQLIEIGNENGGQAYEERYARFYDAIKAKHPAMQLVANVPVRSRPMDILDEHYYSNPEFFLAQSTRYDHYDRKGPSIYVGEYAVTQNCGQGNLRAALGEAAFMTGMERNADIVQMCSYAPMFVNIDNRAWNPGAIVMDSGAGFGIPSYHVQRMFAENRIDTVLPVEAQVAPAVPRARLGGMIGVGNWLAQAEYKDVKVTSGGKTLFAEDFSNGAGRWNVKAGEWSVKDGAFRQTAIADNLRAVAGDPAWKDYTLTLKARKLGGPEGFLIVFHWRDDQNWTWWNIGGWNNTRTAVEKTTAGSKAIIGGDAPVSVEAGRWYDVRVEVAGSRIRCYLDGKLIHDIEDVDVETTPIYADAGSTAGGDLIVKVVNYSPSAQDGRIRLEGAGPVASEGTATVLTSISPEDENSLAHPTRVAPVTRRVTGIGPDFRYTFAPYSLTILRVRAR